MVARMESESLGEEGDRFLYRFCTSIPSMVIQVIPSIQTLFVAHTTQNSLGGRRSAYRARRAQRGSTHAKAQKCSFLVVPPSPFPPIQIPTKPTFTIFRESCLLWLNSENSESREGKSLVVGSCANRTVLVLESNLIFTPSRRNRVGRMTELVLAKGEGSYLITDTGRRLCVPSPPSSSLRG